MTKLSPSTGPEKYEWSEDDKARLVKAMETIFPKDDEMKTLQERLRDGADICHARNIQLDYARVATEAADRIDALENKVDRLEWENKGIAEWRDEWDNMRKQRDENRKCADDAAMAHKIERDGLMEKVAALTKDAERYRAGREAEYAGLMPTFRAGRTWADAMDSAYDAAIAASKEQIK